MGLFQFHVEANQVVDMPLTEKVEYSDLIFVGEILSIDEPVKLEGYIKKVALVNVKKILKGDSDLDKVKFDFDVSISEFRPDCCDKQGEEYLFFLKKDSNSIYYSFNGRFGVYKVVGSTVLNWHSSDESNVTKIQRVSRMIENAKKHTLQKK